MTKKELQSQINFLVDELQKLSYAYKELRDEARENRLDRNLFREMWQEADEKAERYDELLGTIYDIIYSTEADMDYYYEIYKLINDWYWNDYEVETNHNI